MKKNRGVIETPDKRRERLGLRQCEKCYDPTYVVDLTLVGIDLICRDCLTPEYVHKPCECSYYYDGDDGEFVPYGAVCSNCMDNVRASGYDPHRPIVADDMKEAE